MCNSTFFYNHPLLLFLSIAIPRLYKSLNYYFFFKNVYFSSVKSSSTLLSSFLDTDFKWLEITSTYQFDNSTSKDHLRFKTLAQEDNAIKNVTVNEPS